MLHELRTPLFAHRTVFPDVPRHHRFRLACRKLRIIGDTNVPEAMFKYKGLSPAEIAEADLLFKSIDVDGSGALDISEVDEGLRELSNAGAAAREAGQEVRAPPLPRTVHFYPRCAHSSAAEEASSSSVHHLSTPVH